MKKLALFIALTAMAAGSAMAQDTIENRQMDNYYYYGTYFQGKENYVVNQALFSSYGGDVGRFFGTSDTMTIYGIAAGLFDLCNGDPVGLSLYCIDTTYANAIQWLKLYEPHADTLLTVRSTPVHLRSTPVNYYINFFPSMTRPSCIVPIYERYFDTPATVVDSFYAGMTVVGRDMNTESPDYHKLLWPPAAMAYIRADSNTNNFLMGYNPGTGQVWHRTTHDNVYYMLFPILTPNPDTNSTADTTTLSSDTTYLGDTLIVTDTVIIGGDTIVTTDTILSIQNGTLLDRLTGVMPNPAVGTARVVSSFGMSMVEAYDMSGTLVHRQKADGLATTLDVRHWPTGTYLLRIHTPQGTAVKKLVVRR